MPGLYREAVVGPIKLEAASYGDDGKAPLLRHRRGAGAGSRALLVTAAGSCTARGIAAVLHGSE